MERVDVAYVLVFDENYENVLMVKNKGERSPYYTFPGGRVEYGETLEEAAIREVKEETGLDVELEGIFSISEAFFTEIEHHTIFFTFTGKIVGGELVITYPDEIEEIIWMDPSLAENRIHIPNELKGLINRKSTVPYLLRGYVANKS